MHLLKMNRPPCDSCLRDWKSMKVWWIWPPSRAMWWGMGKKGSEEDLEYSGRAMMILWPLSSKEEEEAEHACTGGGCCGSRLAFFSPRSKLCIHT